MANMINRSKINLEMEVGRHSSPLTPDGNKESQTIYGRDIILKIILPREF